MYAFRHKPTGLFLEKLTAHHGAVFTEDITIDCLFDSVNAVEFAADRESWRDNCRLWLHVDAREDSLPEGDLLDGDLPDGVVSGIRIYGWEGRPKSTTYSRVGDVELLQVGVATYGGETLEGKAA